MNASDRARAGNEVAGLAVQPMKFDSLAETARQALADHKAVLASAKGHDVILAYRSNGLAIAFKDGVPFATNISRADKIVGRSIFEITNGNGERAERMTRACAVALYLPTLEKMVVDFEAMEAEDASTDIG